MVDNFLDARKKLDEARKADPEFFVDDDEAAELIHQKNLKTQEKHTWGYLDNIFRQQLIEIRK